MLRFDQLGQQPPPPATVGARRNIVNLFGLSFLAVRRFSDGTGAA
jgi:hypothetical protein